ncbi:phage antirepressor KilAC domain-containing protein [Photorhabdus viridis]|uniref:phage antirepressor KilAC domain-containing protein n=1 Tax=Photorhabdus viridis TaxID=3163327 RepID=UPI003307ADCB
MFDMNVANNNLLVIAGVEITTDTEGRFNLNALHKASGGKDTKRPKTWLETKQAQELVEELRQNSALGQEVLKVQKGGVNTGTFAHELLAISYAGWISPSFQLQVNQTFFDYRTGKLAPVVVDPMQVLNDPAAMRGLLLTYTEKVLTLESQVEEMRPDVEAYDRIAKADGSMCITNAAKHLQIQPKLLFKTLSEKHWIYKRAGGRSWLGYQDKIQQGLLEHKVTIVTKDDGTERVCEQVLVTAKGIAKVSKILNNAIV